MVTDVKFSTNSLYSVLCRDDDDVEESEEILDDIDDSTGVDEDLVEYKDNNIMNNSMRNMYKNQNNNNNNNNNMNSSNMVVADSTLVNVPSAPVSQVIDLTDNETPPPPPVVQPPTRRIQRPSSEMLLSPSRNFNNVNNNMNSNNMNNNNMNNNNNNNNNSNISAVTARF